MTQLRWLLAGIFSLAALSLGISSARGQKQASERAMPTGAAAPERAIRALDANWVKAVAAKKVDEVISFYANDGSVLPPGAPIATGKEAIRKAWAGMLELPGFALTFSPTKIDAAKSLDMAYEIGTYQLTVNDKDGKPQTQQGKYVVVWKRQKNGHWKAVADIFNADH